MFRILNFQQLKLPVHNTKLARVTNSTPNTVAIQVPKAFSLLGQYVVLIINKMSFKKRLEQGVGLCSRVLVKHAGSLGSIPSTDKNINKLFFLNIQSISN
jgi:hypothetical protein